MSAIVRGGALTVVGLGPGSAGLLTPDAAQALEQAQDLVGYGPYLARVAARADQRVHASDNRVEAERASFAWSLAAAGRRVAVVSSGDPGVFAMAAAVLEALEAGPPAWRALELTVLPGVTAMLAAAARVGAPLGHDFCAINLSDNLKPAAVIERRLALAAEAGFAMALYNPASIARPDGFARALGVLRGALAATTPVVFARAVSEPAERVILTTLGEARPDQADMRTLVIVGAPHTRLIERPGRPPLVLTPRAYPEAAS